MHRLFVALRPPAAVRALLATAMGGVPGARWQDDEQLHLTLRFISAVERPQAEEIAGALARVAAPAPTIAIHGAGQFATRGRTHTLWAGVTPQPALAALHHKVDRALALAGIAPDGRAYHPHVTVARIARGAANPVAIERWLADHAALRSDAFTLDRLTLYESHLDRDGARYEPVARWPLG